MLRCCIIFLSLFFGISLARPQLGQFSTAPAPTLCLFSKTLSDGCSGAQANGSIVDSHLADPQAVVALNIEGGSGYTDGTFTWTSRGGGCSRNATGSIRVTGGVIGNNNYMISDPGAGCRARPTILIPAGATGGRGGRITPTVYQATPHNAPSTWSVPGVDYPIGYDPTLPLKDPTAEGLPHGISFAGDTVTVSGNNVTLNGWDFSLHATHLVVDGGTTGVVITNSKFACIPGRTADLDLIHIGRGSVDVTIKYNSFDGSSTPGGCIRGGQNAAIGSVATSGNITIEYNYCYGEDSKCVSLNGGPRSPSTLTVIEKYNFWLNFGVCGRGCSHGEAEYSYSGGTNQILVWTLQFNVLMSRFSARPTNNTSELAIEADGVILNSPDVEYNYALSQGNQAYTGSNNATGQVASASIFCGHQEGGSYSGRPIMQHNIVDYSGAFFPYNTTKGTCASDFPGISDLNAGTGNLCNTFACN